MMLKKFNGVLAVLALCAGLVVVTCLKSCPVFAATNLISNGELEEIDARDYPRGWQKLVEVPLPIDAGDLKMKGNPANSIVSEESHAGKSALAINIPEGKTEIGGWETRVPLKSRSLYRLTFWAKVAGKPYAVVAINEFKDGGVRTAHYERAVQSNHWEQYNIEFETHADSKGAQIHACIWSDTGQAWFDDFILEEMDVSNTAGAKTPDATPYDVLTRAVVTPHIPWAVPYLNGPINVLAIPKHREVVELAQRLEIDYTTWSPFDKSEAGAGDAVLYNLYYGSPERSILSSYKELKTKIQKEYDVILLGATVSAYKPVEWGNLPRVYKQAILDKVKQGTGVILVRPSADSVKELIALMDGPADIPSALSASIPYAGLTVLDKDSQTKDWLQVFRCGKGRVVFVDYQNEYFGFWEGEKYFRRYESPFTPTVSYDYRVKPLYYDYYHSLLAHLVVWAAGKEGQISITKLAFEKNALTVGINNTGSPGERTIEVVVRDPDNQREASYRQKFFVNQGKGNFSLNIPGLKSGDHFADVWLKNSEGKTITWGSIYLRTEAPVNITGIKTDKSSYRPGEAIKGTLVLNENLPAGMKVQLQISDSLGRLLLDKELTASDGKRIPFQYSLSAAVAILHQIKARVLTDNNEVMSEKTAEVIVRKSTEELDDYRVYFWAQNANNNLHNRYMLEDFYLRGFDTAFIYYLYPQGEKQLNPLLLNTVRHNLDLGLFAFSLACWDAGSDPTQTISPRCLTAPGFRSNMFGVLSQHSSVAKNYPVYGYGLGDEAGVAGYQQDYCFSPTCLDYARNFLKSEYSSLDNLNREWETSFNNWEEVKPMTKAEAKTHDNFAPWVDHRRAMESMFADLLRESTEVVRRQDPAARVGLDGITGSGMDPNHAESSTLGYDFGRIIPAGNFWTVYFQHYPQIEFLRSFAGPNSVVGTYTQPFEDYPKGYFEDAWQNEKVNRFVPWYGLFHGMNSVMYWGIMDTKWYGVYHPDYTPAPWLKPIEETIREVKSGIGKMVINCRRENYGIAVHYSQASLHVETIMGTRERGRSLRSFPLLLEDIGLQYDMLSREQIAGGKLDNYKVLVLPFSYAISGEERQAIASFVARGGLVVADGTPGITDGHGKKVAVNMLDGIAMYKMKNPVWEYDEMRVRGEGNAQMVELQQVLGNAGISPRFKIVSKNNSAPAGCELVSLRDKGAEYLGILQGREFIRKAGDDHTPEPVKIVLDKKYHVYSVREGCYLGFADTIDTEIEPATAKLYALLPAAAGSPSLEQKKQVYAPGETVDYIFEITSNPPAKIPRVFRVEVEKPDGTLYREYARNIYTTDGKGEGSFGLALNDVPGIWRITATDVASGAKTSRQFTVKW